MKINKSHILLYLMFFAANCLNAQTYNSSDYAKIGDTVYMTKSGMVTKNYDTTGIGIHWNYSDLEGLSQSKIIFRNPTETGYSFIQWPYIYNTGNVNLSSTNGKTLALASFQITNLNEYFKKTETSIEQKAASYTISLNGVNMSIKTPFSSPDKLYTFPISFGNKDSSNASYITNIPGTFYEEAKILRKNIVDGSGTISTPYGNFYNALRLVSYVKKTDSVAILGIGLPSTITESREIKWLDATKKYPILLVTQALVGNKYVTQSVEYLDKQQFYQPVAFFAYYPLSPSIGDTVLFQNLTTNATEYFWSFADHSSPDSVSKLLNPTHIFNQAGIFQVKLIAVNGTLSDTISIPVSINNGILPLPSFTVSDSVICVGDSIKVTNSSSYGSFYSWQFTGGTPMNYFSADPPSIYYNTKGEYVIKLVVSNSNGVDSVTKSIKVLAIPDKPEKPMGDSNFCNTGNIKSYTIQTSKNSESYLWKLLPQNSGKVSNKDTLANIEWDPNYIGISKMCVVAQNKGCSSLASDTLYIILNDLPLRPQKPIGDTVIARGVYSSTYKIQKVDNALTYQWSLTTINAGTIAGNDSIATVIWDEAFSGVAGISVRGVNECGLGTNSDTLFIDKQLVNSVLERKADYISIYPNPALEGLVNISISTVNENCYIEIFSPEGLFITSCKFKNNKSLYLSKGVKILKFKIGNEVIVKKLVVY